MSNEQPSKDSKNTVYEKPRLKKLGHLADVTRKSGTFRDGNSENFGPQKMGMQG